MAKSSKIFIKPRKNFSFSDIREIWDHKELMYFFTWRDIKVRYRQTALGALWAIFQPFMAMVIFSVFFGKFIGVPSDGVPYPIFVYIGLLFWQFFSGSLSDISNILVNNHSIITKIYFPRLILPYSSVITKLIDFMIAAVILILMMIYYGYMPHLLALFIIPLLIIITFMASMGAGLILASLNVKYRDVKYILPYFIQLLMFVTPVIYPASIAGSYKWILSINPMMGVIQNSRAALLGTGPIDWILILISLISTLILMILGIYIFKRTEHYLADII